MKFLTIAVFLIGSATTVSANTGADPSRYDLDELITFLEGSYQVAAVMCFKSGEQSSGMNKICYYDCLGSPAAITIGATQLCPLTIKR
jgi:hypothetical protein